MTIAQPQATPTFETTVWFEDAVGNRDSIVIGCDPFANDQYNPDFGEEDIKSPFDSIFEVRATHRIAYHRKQYVLSKKVVSQMGDPMNPATCLWGEAICFVKAKYQPITVSWDQPLLADNACFEASFLTPNLRWELVIPFELDWTTIRARCMTNHSSYELYLDTRHIPQNEVPYLITHPRQQNGVDSLTGIIVALNHLWWFYPLCRVSSTAEPTSNISASFIAPNPAIETIAVGRATEEMGRLIQVLNVEGKVLRQTVPDQGDGPTSLFVGDLPPSVYAVVEHLSHGKIRTGRFVKL